MASKQSMSKYCQIQFLADMLAVILSPVYKQKVISGFSNTDKIAKDFGFQDADNIFMRYTLTLFLTYHKVRQNS